MKVEYFGTILLPCLPFAELPYLTKVLCSILGWLVLIDYRTLAWREGEREGGREGEREGGREGGRERELELENFNTEG